MTGLVRYERVTGILRFYPPGAGEMAPYVGAGTVVWRDARSFEIRGLKAELTRQHWRALVELARELGVARIFAKRGPGHLLPFARPAEDGWQVIELVDIDGESPVTGFADLPD